MKNLLKKRRRHEALSFRDVRPERLQYFFAFPLAMVFVNTQDLLTGLDGRVLGLMFSTITFLAFIAGAVTAFAFSSPRNISAVCRCSASIIAAGFIAMLFLQSGYAGLISAMILMAGIGGALSAGSFSFVFVLNNAERFLSCAFMVLLIKSYELIGRLPAIQSGARTALAIILLVPLCLCLAASRNEDHAPGQENTVRRFDGSIWLVLFILLSYFAIRITGFYAPAFGHPPGARLWGVLALLLLTLCILLQLIFRRSVWTLCNVFFLSSILSYVMWYMDLPAPAYMFSELKDIGMLISLYLIGCITNKFCDFRTHKRLVLVCIMLIGFLYLMIDSLHGCVPEQPLAVGTAAVLFAVFLLLSPAFSRHLFFAEWSGEFIQPVMTAPADGSSPPERSEHSPAHALDGTALSPREKQLALLLLRGLTVKQAASELGLTVSTAATYSKNIYKKLGINSRAELFIMFGHGQENAPGRSDPHK